MDVRDGKIENLFEEFETTSTEPTTTSTVEPTTAAPVVILVDDQPAPANTSVAPKKPRKGRKGRKRLPRSPRRGRPTRKRFRSRYRNITELDFAFTLLSSKIHWANRVQNFRYKVSYNFIVKIGSTFI